MEKAEGKRIVVDLGMQGTVSRKQEAGSRKQEAGSRKQEAGSRKQEAGSRKPLPLAGEGRGEGRFLL